MSQNTLLYFVKFPEPGKVKTRLAKTLGFVEAANAYRLLAEANLLTLRTLVSRGIDIRIVFDPPHKAKEMKRWLSPHFEYYPQCEGDLGARLTDAFEASFKKSKKVIALGSDTLGLSEVMIEESFYRLENSDLVIGPAFDGGYYLIGLKEPQPDLFSNIPWSTQDVLSATLKVSQTKKMTHHLLCQLNDLDEIKSTQIKGVQV